MIDANLFRKFCSRTGAVIALALTVCAMLPNAAPAAERKPNVNFNHLKTGFPLTGAHATLPCETCHVQGTLQGHAKTVCDLSYAG